MLRKPDLYNKSVALRKKGLSYNEIRKFVNVGHGTISRWCSKISLTEEQKKRLIEKKRNTPLIRRLREQAVESKRLAKIWAKEKVSKIPVNNKTLFIMGVALYWAEGTKSGGGGGIEFTNTDYKMIRMMMRFFREFLNISDHKFKITVRIGSRGNVKRAEKYWLRATNLQRKNLCNPELLNLKERSRSLEKHPYGMCRITIHDALSRRKILNAVEELSIF